MAERVSKEFLRVAAYWVGALRLNEWRLEFAVGTDEQLEDEGNLAQVVFVSAMKSATIYMRRLTALDHELEEDLVHELLHLVLIEYSQATAGMPTHQQIAQEFAVNVLAENLVTLRRRSAK